jgi:HAD superfamily hydrolase (TIGR01509 family)
MNNHPSQIKAALCDLDGTLLDSNALHAEAWQRTFEHFGIPVTFDQALKQIGKGGDHLIPVFLEPRDRDRLSKPIEEYRKQLFESVYFPRIKPFPKCRELLIKMKTAGLRIAISSSANKKDVTRLKEIAAITDLVDEETSSDDVEKSKPSPDIFEATLERLAISHEETLALGDTPYDIQAAGKAKIMTVAVTSGGWSEDDLKHAGALEVYRDIAHLTEEFENSAFKTGLRTIRT